MRLPSRSGRGGLKFNITPLIDVVFQLIIFFLAASHLARAEVRDEVQLPEAETGEDDRDDDRRRMIFTLSFPEVTDGQDPGSLLKPRIETGGQVVELHQVEPQLKQAIEASGQEPRDFEVRVRTDRRVPYGTVRELLTGCSRAGVTTIKFVVLPK